MTSSGAEVSVREAVAVFEDAQTLQEAIDELLRSGFNRAELSLLAGEHAVDEKLGHRFEKVEELEDEDAVPRTAYVSPESIGDAEGGLIGALMYVGAVTAAGAMVATGGALVPTIAAAVAAGSAGGAIGSILARWIDKHHADYLQEQLEHGGILLWVRTWDPEQETRAKEVLSKHSARDVHVHGLTAKAE